MTTTIAATSPAAKPVEVVAVIRSASKATGSDFDYLLATAKRESNLNSQAKSKSSSAAGLFQFIEQTWLSLVKRHGARHGLGHFAAAISETGGGRYVVATPQARSAILALREDPKISALMAGEAAVATKQSLEVTLGRTVYSGELYAAHFLGEGGARRLIALNEDAPSARADLAFPDAAKANRNVFYHADGAPKTIGEVHAWAVGDPAPARRPTIVALTDTPRAARIPSTTAQTHETRDAGENPFGLTIRGSRLVALDEAPPKVEPGLPRLPLALSSSLLDVLAAIASPPVERRSGANA